MRAILLAALFILGLACPALSVEAKDACLGCHKTETPGIVAYYEGSAHHLKGLACTECHGSDPEASHSRRSVVDAGVCGRCHRAEYETHLMSRHAMSLKSGRGCTRNMPGGPAKDGSCQLCHEAGSTVPRTDVECAMFLAQTEEMQRVGCGTCHRVETGCETCHSRHGTGLEQARAAETCGVCHMGPDHAQYEMWKSSPHGVLFGTGGAGAAPTCVTCHMPRGSHDVSAGIATGRPEAMADKERQRMLDICAGCHTRAMASRGLADADAVERQSRAMLGEAMTIVNGLQAEGLLDPAPGERPGHPIFGHEFVLGPHMVYEDISGAEARFFRMMLFNYMSAFKGAFHQNPDYSHWYGNAPLKLGLSELRSEAALLRKVNRLGMRVDNLSGAGGAEDASAGAGPPVADVRVRLRQLRERWLRGEISDAEYDYQKRLALDGAGL